MWVEGVATTLDVYSQLTKEDSNGRRKGSEGTTNHLTLASKVSVWWMATLQVEMHYTSSGNQEGCSFPELVHREPRELKLLWFIENMTAHVDQLPSSQNKNKLRTDEMKWLAHHHVWAKRKARLWTLSRSGLLSVAMTCLTSKILHLFLMLMLSCSLVNTLKLSLPPLHKTSEGFMNYFLWYSWPDCSYPSFVFWVWKA